MTNLLDKIIDDLKPILGNNSEVLTKLGDKISVKIRLVVPNNNMKKRFLAYDIFKNNRPVNVSFVMDQVFSKYTILNNEIL